MRFSVLETTVDVSAMIGRMCDMKIREISFLDDYFRPAKAEHAKTSN